MPAPYALLDAPKASSYGKDYPLYVEHYMLYRKTVADLKKQVNAAMKQRDKQRSAERKAQKAQAKPSGGASQAKPPEQLYRVVTRPSGKRELEAVVQQPAPPRAASAAKSKKSSSKKRRNERRALKRLQIASAKAEAIASIVKANKTIATAPKKAVGRSESAPEGSGWQPVLPRHKPKSRPPPKPDAGTLISQLLYTSGEPDPMRRLCEAMALQKSHLGGRSHVGEQLRRLALYYR